MTQIKLLTEEVVKRTLENMKEKPIVALFADGGEYHKRLKKEIAEQSKKYKK